MKRRIRYKRKEHRGVDLKQRIKEYPQKMFDKSGARRFVINKNAQQRRTETKNDYDESIAHADIVYFFKGFINPHIFWDKLPEDRQKNYLNGYKSYAIKYRMAFLVALAIGFCLAVIIFISSYYLMKYTGIIA